MPSAIIRRVTGALFNPGNGSSLSLSGCTISDNTASEDGGGIFNGGTLTLGGSTIANNTANGPGADANYGAVGGGGIFNSGTLTVASSSISGNTAPNGSGGGINNLGTLALSDSTLADNTTPNEGGGLFSLGAVVFESCTVAANTASNGGGIYGLFGTMTVVNSTIADNSAEGGQGGGIWNSAALTVVSSTIAYNSSSGGGGIQDQSGDVTLNNTIVVANGGYDLEHNYNTGGGFTGANNMVGSLAFVDLSGSDNLLGLADPGIGLLANNGGPTQTIALLAGSPAIDAGSNALAVDPTTGQPLAYDRTAPATRGSSMGRWTSAPFNTRPRSTRSI